MEKAAFPVAAESATNQASLQAAWGLGCRPGWEAIAERSAGHAWLAALAIASALESACHIHHPNPAMFNYLRQRRRDKQLREFEMPQAEWRHLLAQPIFAGLSADEQERLRELVIWFLYDK